MIRRLILLVCCGMALAAEAPSLLGLAPEAQAEAVRRLVAATTVHLPGGRTTLADAVAALATGGNRVVLAEGLDGSREAAVAACDGAWWDALLAVCNAFSLRFDAGIPGSEDLSGEGSRVPVGHGSLVLSADPAGPPPCASAGAVVLVAEPESVRSSGGTRTSVRLWLRAEPRLPRGSLAWARADNVRLERDGKSTPLQSAGDGGEAQGRPDALFSGDSGSGDGHDTLLAGIRLAPVEHWKARLALKPGQAQTVNEAGRQLEIILHVDAAPVEWQGAPLPDRRPMLLLSGSGDALDSLQATLTTPAGEVQMRGSSMRGGPDNQRAMMRFLRAPPDGEVTAELAGRVAVAPVQLQIGVRLGQTATATAPLVDPDAPTRVAWEAGTAPLSRWIAALSATGNPVLLEVGIPASAPVAMPAVAGSYWDAVLAVCRAADLAVTTAAPSPGIAGGALRLSRRAGRPLLAAACGPILALATAIPATVTSGGRQERRLQIELALFAEPRVPADRFGVPTMAWASFASDQDGAPRNVSSSGAESDPAASRERLLRPLLNRRTRDRELPGGATAATVRLAGGERQITLSGLLFLPRSRPLHANAELTIGSAEEVMIGGQMVEVLAHSAKSAPMPGNLPADATGILLRGLNGVDSVRIGTAMVDGAPIDGTAEANQMGDRNGGPLWLAWCRLPPEGRVAVTITACTPEPPLALPMTIQVPVP